MKDKIQHFFEVFHKLEISWQIYTLLIIYVLITIGACYFLWPIGLLLIGLLIFMLLFFIYNINNFLRDINVLANKLSKEAKIAQNDSLQRSPIAIIIYDDNKRVKWINTNFQKIIGKKRILGKNLSEISNDFPKYLAIEDDDSWHIIQFLNKTYRVLHQKEEKTLYLLDIDYEYNILEQKKYDQLVFGYLFLDDYDELVQSLDDQEESKFDAEILNDLNNWAKMRNFYLKRLDTDKFILLANTKVLMELEKDKFKYLEGIRQKNYVKNIPISISLGLAYSEELVYQVDDLANYAQTNLDLALGRGGDQTVVRSITGKARYYGGNTNPTEKRTNVRSKLVYQALQNSINQADKVYIAGHKFPDMDSIGSALGIQKIISLNKKMSKIIIDETQLNQDVQQLLSNSSMQKDWTNYFIDLLTVKKEITSNSLIIMVDHHRPILSQAEDLVMNYDTLIIDHHRRSEDFPTHSVLTFIEPYASSTSELITEFYIYMRDTKESINKFEATALLAGIMVDTNNFALRTGSRTFDAASYLRSRGADMGYIQRLLKEDINYIRQRNRLIDSTEYIGNGFAVVTAENSIIYDNVIASQTADQLLTLKDVEASFVIYRRSEDTIGISSRSLGQINVQTIMEKLDGGGHLSNAATQIKNHSTNEVYGLLVKEIHDLMEEK